MRLKLDENLGRRWLQQLRDASHDVDNVRDEGLLVTLDLDFANPLRFPPSETAGIAVLRVRDRPGRDDLDVAVGRLAIALETADLTGHLWIVERERVRQYQAPAD